jgi:hypothetical protein
VRNVIFLPGIIAPAKIRYAPLVGCLADVNAVTKDLEVYATATHPLLPTRSRWRWQVSIVLPTPLASTGFICTATPVAAPWCSRTSPRIQSE